EQLGEIIGDGVEVDRLHAGARKAEALPADVALQARYQLVLGLGAGLGRRLPLVLLAALEVVGGAALDAGVEEDPEAARRSGFVIRHVVGVVVVLRYADGLDAVKAALVEILDQAD